MSSDRRHKLSFELRDETVRRAAEPETGPEDKGRSESELVEDGVVVRADDLRSLRAAVNGWGHLASVAKETERIAR